MVDALSTSELLSLVDDIPVFDAFDERERRTVLSYFQSRVYHPGELICREGDQAFNLFIIGRGTVEIFKDLGMGEHRERLGQLGRGAMIGQVSLIDGKPRSASVQAKSQVLMFECSREDFERLFRSGNPFAYKLLDQILKQLSRRLRDANLQLYNLYSRPTETLLKLHNAIRRIQRTINDTSDSWDDVDVIAPIVSEVDQ